MASKANNDIATALVRTITKAEQLDLLHVSVTRLFDMISAGEFDLFISQSGKSLTSKQRFLDKVFADIVSPELRAVMRKQPLAFFSSNTLEPFLSSLRAEAAKIAIVSITIAIELQEGDLAKLSAEVSEQLEAPVAFDITVDSSIIGGAIVSYGSYSTDSTLRSKLESLSGDWKQAIAKS